MAQSKTKSKKGFTIIEVVLVLAIAGLIFLMVFVALPALQRSQRDTQRRDDMARAATAITQYQTNNNGKLPSDGGSFKTNYLDGDNFKDPDGADYNIDIVAYDVKLDAVTGKLTFDHTVHIVTGALCDGEVATNTNAKTRSYAILYKLEGSGTYCADNK